MESSTQSKFVLSELDAFETLRKHNQLVISHCLAALPNAGVVLNSLGDAVVVKFPQRDDGVDAMTSCLAAARSIITAFESLTSIETIAGGRFQLRTKLLLQHYDAFLYGRVGHDAALCEELVGPDIDLAFRLAPVAWRLQVLVTEAFMTHLLSSSTKSQASANYPQQLLNLAHAARHTGALAGAPLQGILAPYDIEDISYWVTDAREIGRLKGIAQTRCAFAVAFESPCSLVARGELQRLTIKVRQDHHAVILASISLSEDFNDNYIEHVVERLKSSHDGNRLDSELTLFAAAKIYGEFDFFFRVACIDDESLRRIFEAVRADSIGVSHVEVRSVVADRLAITRRYEQIFTRFAGQPYELVLTWFERVPGRDIFQDLRLILEDSPPNNRAVEILEVGEVIHRTPVYAIFMCASMADYAAFFAAHKLRPTACRSHVGHIDRDADAQLRYSLMSGVYMPQPANAD